MPQKEYLLATLELLALTEFNYICSINWLITVIVITPSKKQKQSKKTNQINESANLLVSEDKAQCKITAIVFADFCE